MPKNLLVFSGNFVYTMFGNYECIEYDKRGMEEDKLWGTGKQTINNAKTNKIGKSGTKMPKKKFSLRRVETCELDDHCIHSFCERKTKNQCKNTGCVDDLTKYFLTRFAPVFKQRVKFFGNLYYKGENYKKIIENMITKGNELWAKEQATDDKCGEGKCQGSWRSKMKLFWYATLSLLEFIKRVLNKYGNNLPDLYFTTMAWANYIPSITEYKNIFPESNNGKRPQEISSLMHNLIEPENQQNTDYTFKKKFGYDWSPPLVVIDCGSSGTRIEINKVHPIFKEECGDKIKRLVKKTDKIVALHKVPDESEYNQNKEHEVSKFIESLKKIFSEASKCRFTDSYGMLLATAGLRNWYNNPEDKEKQKTQAKHIHAFVKRLLNEARIVSCQMLDGVNEAALEHNAIKNILIESNLYCPKDNLIMFSMGGQSTQGSNGKLHFSNDKLGAIALTKSCKETEQDVKTSITEKLESFGDLGYKPVNQSDYVFDDSDCDKKRKLKFNPKLFTVMKNDKFLEPLQILDEEDSIETYLKRCDSDGDGFLTVEEIHDCKLGNISGGSKKKRKRKSKRRPKSKKAGILSKQIRKIRRKRKIVSRRR